MSSQIPAPGARPVSENLTIRFHGRHVDWLLLDEASGIVRLRGAGDFEEFAALIEDVHWSGETRVLIGGEDVLLTRARIPSRQQRQIVQAVPYAVEEELACNVDDCHFALGKRDGNGELEVAVINRTTMRSILAELQDAGLQPTFMSADLLMIPLQDGTNILIDGERAHLLTQECRGFTTSIGQLALMVSLLDENDRDRLQVHLHTDAREDARLCLSQIQASGSVILQHELDYQPFEFICRNFNKSNINLLQGEFKIEEARSASGNGWRAAAILAGCAFLAHVLLIFGQGVYLQTKASIYADEAVTLYKEVFPDDRNVRDIRRRWRGHLGGAAVDTGMFLPLFEETAKEISSSSLVLQNINYNEARGDLILQLIAARSEQLVLFVESLTRGGLQAEIGTISQDENSVRGSVKVKSSGGRR